MKHVISVVISILLLGAHSVGAQEWGPWRMGYQIDSMTEKKTTFIHGNGENVMMEVICDILKDPQV